MKYIPYIIIASIVILLLIYIFIIRPIQIKKLISQKVLSYFNNIGYSEVKHNKLSDLVLEKEGQKIYFKYLMIPSNSQITINCKEKWRLSWGGSSAKVGRAYPNNRYLTEIEDFAGSIVDGKKIIIVYYSTEHILKYINECELENIDITKNTYDYKIVCFNKFEEEIPYCINK
ncbi:MAG: hypothetical protein J5691_06940 [Bacilli bacterium]|nr:hypothetical protein [Bacilli bacterium]